MFVTEKSICICIWLSWFIIAYIVEILETFIFYDFETLLGIWFSARKGEVSDLKSQLRQLAGSRAPGVDDSKRDLFKKVISYMTIGIDVSAVFGEMVMCSATSDIVLKKMCYLYVGNYAKVNPDLALLTINFLQRDCKDADPMIRGLALRSLCSLRVANLVEYLVGPLGSGLKDNSSYVRIVAVMGVLKLYHISASTCVDAEFPQTLKQLMLSDSDTQVTCLSLSFSTFSFCSFLNLSIFAMLKWLFMLYFK